MFILTNIGILVKLLASKGKSVRPLLSILIVLSFGIVPNDEAFIYKEQVFSFLYDSSGVINKFSVFSRNTRLIIYLMPVNYKATLLSVNISTLSDMTAIVCHVYKP